MLSFLDWAIIGLYLIISLLIGLYYTKKAGESSAEFFLGGRNTVWWLAGLSMVATTFGADTPLAVTEIVRKNGVSGNWLWWSFLSGGMLTTFFFARLWRRSGVMTDVEFVMLRYSGPEARFLRGFKALYFGVFMNTVIMGWVNLAMVAILQTFFGLDFTAALWYTAAAMALTTVYTALSGIKGVIVTDAFQFIVAMAGSIILAIAALNTEQVGGLSGLKTALAANHSLDFLPHLGKTDGHSLFNLSITAFVSMMGFQWWASWYPGAEPGGGGYIAQRMLSAKDERHSLAATLLFQILHYAVRPWPWILVGLASLILYPNLSEADSKLGYVYAMRDLLPAGLKGLLLVSFFAAYMSTLSTHLNWGLSYIINDFYIPYLRPRKYEGEANPADEKHYILVSRVCNFGLMLLSLGVTTQMTSIDGAWKFIMACGAGLGLTLILRWYWWRVSAWCEITATLTPFVCMGLFEIFELKNYLTKNGWVANADEAGHWLYLCAIGVTTAAWLAAAYVLPQTDPKQLKIFFDRVQPQGWWPFAPERPHPTPVWVLAVCWVLGVGLVYAMLFAIGQFLMLNPQNGFALAAAAVAMALGVRYFALRYDLFR